MNSKKYAIILTTIVQKLVPCIKEKLNIDYEEAMNLLYQSKLYKALEKEETKMWYFSYNSLLEMFLNERKTGNYWLYENK